MMENHNEAILMPIAATVPIVTGVPNIANKITIAASVDPTPPGSIDAAPISMAIG